jgi:type II secretory pathway pseudopilin PulG
LATIAILAVLITIASFFIANYITYSRQISDKQTLSTLNDALTRYKTEGGDITALTSDAPIGNVLRNLKTPVNWAGMIHQFIQTGITYPSRSLSANNDGVQYRFYRFNSYIDKDACYYVLLSNGRVKGDFGGGKSPNGTYNSPDGVFDTRDFNAMLLALNNPAAYLALNPTLSAPDLLLMGDFGGAGDFGYDPDSLFNFSDIDPMTTAAWYPEFYKSPSY